MTTMFAICVALLMAAVGRADGETRIATGGGGARLAYETQGKGPLLILIHGAGQDRHIWDKHAAELARDFTVVTFDVRGHGQSDRPDRPDDYAIDRYLEDLHRLADAAGAKRFSLWGFSLGASIAINAAARSDRIDRAVAAGSVFGQIFTEEMLGGTVTRIRTLLDAQQKGTLDVNALKENERAAITRGDLPPTLAWALAAPKWPAVAPRDVRCPLLLYVGTEDKAVIGRVRSDEAEIASAGVALRILPGLNHFEEVTRMDVVMPIVREFLRGRR